MRASPATPYPQEAFDAALLCVSLASRAYRGNKHPRYPSGVEARIIELLALPGVAELVASLADHLRWEAADQVVSWLAREQGMQRLTQLARREVATGEPLPAPESPAVASFLADHPHYTPLVLSRIPAPILPSPEPPLPEVRTHLTLANPDVVAALHAEADAAEADFEAMLAELEPG